MKAGDDYLFVHVPKTGGMSVEACLVGEPNPFGVSNHAPLRQVQDMAAGRFTFGFVRNPWARLVSLYEYQRRQQGGTRYGFKETLMQQAWLRIKDSDAGRYGWRDALWFLQGADFIGQTERLQEHFDVVCYRLGLEQQMLPVKNGGDSVDYRSYYDDESREYVAHQHRDTVAAFGYQF